MDRYDEVKSLLKRWELQFLGEHRRKPCKEDVDQAPEDIRGLYRDYRTLKRAKEQSGSHDPQSQLLPGSAEPPAPPKDSDCWGSHLNRRAMPGPPPKLTQQDRDGLQASSQYYGLKLKNNLAALRKETPSVLKKPKLTGRVPLSFLMDDRTKSKPSSGSAGAVLTVRAEPPSSPLRRRTPPSPLPQTCSPAEPEEPFRAFEAEPGDAVRSCRRDEPAGSFSSAVEEETRGSPGAPGGARPPGAPGGDGPPEESGGDGPSEAPGGGRPPGAPVGGGPPGAPGSRGTSHRNVDSGTSAVFEACPAFLKRSVGAGVGWPTPARRLSVVDRKWLQRCQVFGEMSVEERPAAGNQEMKPEERLEENGTENDGRGKEKKDGGREGGAETEMKPVRDLETPQLQRRKKRGDRKQEEDLTRGGVASVTPPDDGSLKSKKTQRKRQRQEDKPEEGGQQKKKRRSAPQEPPRREEEEKRERPREPPRENLLGEIQEEFVTKGFRTPSAKPSSAAKGAEGNFVKINLKKKSHVKGYALRGQGLRRQLSLQKFQMKGERFGGGGGRFGRGRRGGFRGGASRHGDTCFRCGGTGHWATDCRGPVPPPPDPEEPPAAEEEEPFELPTLEEVARATGTLQSGTADSRHHLEKAETTHHEDEALLNVIRPDYECPAPPPPMEPLYALTEDGKVQETPEAVYAALRDLGYQSFRAGQEEAIMRILSGLSTLVVLSTGMGKSLCYQLPAYLYAQRSRCISLVISPLISLMDDQLSGLPAKLRAACIHSNMTRKQREAAIEKVKSGQVCFLLVSPEVLVGSAGSGAGCLPSAQELPPVAFACIDEAHCVSEWSHNFRPCYLRLCKVLRERLGVQCFLGLTATATLSTALDIARHLGISDQQGISVRSAAVPPNLNLSVSMDREKDQALVSLLKGERFGCLDSIIVYCTRREETLRVAALLRTCLQGVLLSSGGLGSQTDPAAQRKKELARKKIRKPLKWLAESYHAGMSAAERRRVQNNFMCGELRIVVATVAFGMGLDKSDVRGVVHYNMPKSFESYVQEIGRAGRDGEPAHCHLFLDAEGADLRELRRHIYADTVDYYTIKRLLQRVFPACTCRRLQQHQQGRWKDVEDSDLLEVMKEHEQENGPDRAALQVRTEGSGAQENEPDRADLQVRTEGSGAQQAVIEDVDQDLAALGHASMEDGTGRADLTTREWRGGVWPERRACCTHERAIPIQEVVEALDVPEEGVETLLCYLELHPQRWVELLHPTLSVCKVSCYDGPKQLQKVTKICPPVAVVLARKRMAGERVERCDQVEFDVVEVADIMGWQLPLVKRGLRQLQWSTDRAGGRSGVLVEFSAISFYFRSYGDLSPEEMDVLCHFLHGRVQEQERTRLQQLTACFKAFRSVAFQSVLSCVQHLDRSRSQQLKALLSEYFDRKKERGGAVQLEEEPEDLDTNELLDWEEQVRTDIRRFLALRSDEKFSGRAVARILHGIGSPRYPAQIYGRDRRFWRKYLHLDFNRLIQMATQEIIGFK
ncbi:ATP-dependent DNA helicase Q4 isoform X4 [Oryzias melastigma]|uniref:ATP-dependent DNA helicase Q4 isoform X4 n=1 Tax=Oryzias melastigma TaxID=30732 RepID=UPI000CF7F1CE|nr:ATP-dependent DNA helicase Q4 isoform X4 [Oryzias melastigma]